LGLGQDFRLLGFHGGFFLRHKLGWHKQISDGVVLPEHLLHRPLDFTSEQPFQMSGLDVRQFGKT